MELDIHNEFDYSHLLAEKENIVYLVKYCDALYTKLMSLIEEDEEKNKKLKLEFKEYQYKKSFSSKFEVTIKEKGSSFGSIVCKNYASFLENLNEGHLSHVEYLTILLDMSYIRGKTNAFVDHNNMFKIVFKPYDIKFIRISNHKEEYMDEIEATFNQMLKQFKTCNTIFCTKE